MTILPYNQNHELKEGWLKTIEAIEKRCIRSFPVAIKQHKVYSKGSCSCEEITELVGMVRKHQKSYSKIHHRAILSTLSFVKDSISDSLLYLERNLPTSLAYNINVLSLIFHAVFIPNSVKHHILPTPIPFAPYIIFWLCIGLILGSMHRDYDRKQYARRWVFFKAVK
jgi:hypothetical protein